MCLDTVDKEIKKTKGLGWKRFEPNNKGELLNWVAGCEKRKPLAVGEWLTAKPIKDPGIPLAFGYVPYFHVFDTKKGAETYDSRTDYPYKVRKVQYDKVTATGKEEYGCNWFKVKFFSGV